MSIAALLASIALHVPLPTGVTVVRGPCPAGDPQQIAGCANATTIYANVNPAKDGSLYSTLVIAHELGHAWDLQNLSGVSHARYAALIGRGTIDWWYDATGLGLAPAENFADAYAWCAVAPGRRRKWSTNGSYTGLYGERVSHQILADTCWWLHHPPTT